ncbi:r3h domain [Diplodia corticola]|uniref:R3h domain n=1 Tax=Diplodia corticola TaxID=236234 RepID=A0A1J9QNQ9_9PEZI|nr:r3h domain [Diplodia corticola]OJD30081.1 r3h domain [Diplodia corticola]
MSNHPHDMYYDNPSSRSPGSQRHQPQTLHRQPSRQFDAYGQLNQGLYAQEDPQARYDAPRYNDRLNATIHAGYGGYELGGAQGWNANAFGQNNSLAAINATTRMKPSARGGRSALPQTWLDQSQQQLPSINTFSGLGGASLGGGQNLPQGLGQGIGQPQMRQDPYGPSEVDEELIPTAIVIKNIPFAVKKEQLVQLMTDLRLPLPYAFNYHFDNGVFRGLAFANFTTAEETAVVIETMNHFELQGRKLRVEYKKMLPLAERERIEREKRERRGQLEEQHRPMPASQLQSQPSLSSMSSHVPPATSPSPVNEVDMNDPQVLQFYSQLLLFKEDPNRDVLVFPSTLTPSQRRVCHTIAHQMGLSHNSKGMGDQRQVHVYKYPAPDTSPPMSQMAPTSHPLDPQRRGLNRAATTDFSDVREGFYGGTLGRQSSGLLGFPDSPGGGLTAAPNLRAAKSYADLRSYTPSPVPSTASFPATLGGNINRYQDYGTSSTNPSLTPTATSMANRDDSLLVNGLSGMSLGGGFGQGGSPRGLRGMVSWESDRNPGPIGGHRSFSNNFDGEQSRDRSQGLPTRQPRGPIPERGSGFSRGRQNGHHGRGSDELSSQSGVEIVVE